MTFPTGLANVRPDVPLAPFTWFRLGGPAQYFVEPASREELQQVVRGAKTGGLPMRVLGAGSNVLVSESGVPGLVVHLSHATFAQVSVNGTRLKAGGGAKLGQVVATAVREGLGGLETLVGIPGTVGGALRMNA